jgi:phytoene synthase
MTDAAVKLAYHHCEQVTRRRARNFYSGIRLLPPAKRAAMCALYAMARRVDDVGDDVYGPVIVPPPGHEAGPGATAADGAQGGPAVQRRDRERALTEVRTSLALVAKAADRGAVTVPPGDPVLMALADAANHFPLPMGAFEELVEGCEWDVAGRSYDTADDLVEYCRRVAGAIGRLSLAVYGSSAPTRAEPLADALGVALQLTNILRDIVEDRDVMGRVYIPREDRERFGIGPQLQGRPEDLMALVCFESGRAAEWYQRGLGLLPLLDQRSRACTAAMAGIYLRLLDKIRARPDEVMARRVSLSAAEKAAVAVTALAKGKP